MSNLPESSGSLKHSHQDDEIDLVQLLSALWSGKITILLTTLIAFSVFYILRIIFA